jgi:hypothetical protein
MMNFEAELQRIDRDMEHARLGFLTPQQLVDLISRVTGVMSHTRLTLIVPPTINEQGYFDIRVNGTNFTVLATVPPGEIMEVNLRIPMNMQYVRPNVQYATAPRAVPRPGRIPVAPRPIPRPVPRPAYYDEAEPMTPPGPPPPRVIRPKAIVKAIGKKVQTTLCGDMCPICIEPFTKLDSVTLPCNHEVCTTCMNDMCVRIDVNKPCVCPLCRQAVDKYTTYRKWGKK